MHVIVSSYNCKFQPKEGITAGYDRFFSYNRITPFDRFQVPSVILVTGIVDAKSKRKDSETRSAGKRAKGFDEIFQEAIEDVEQEDMVLGQTTGYTRDARSITQNASRHEYSI